MLAFGSSITDFALTTDAKGVFQGMSTALEQRGREVERNEELLRGLAQAIRTVLDEASVWLGEAIPASVREAVPALPSALQRIRSEPKNLEDEGPGM